MHKCMPVSKGDIFKGKVKTEVGKIHMHQDESEPLGHNKHVPVSQKGAGFVLDTGWKS